MVIVLSRCRCHDVVGKVLDDYSLMRPLQEPNKYLSIIGIRVVSYNDLCNVLNLGQRRFESNWYLASS